MTVTEKNTINAAAMTTVSSIHNSTHKKSDTLIQIPIATQQSTVI